MRTESFFFELQVPVVDDERVTGKIHKALLEFAEFNADGNHPAMDGWRAKNGVWIQWSKTAKPLTVFEEN
jgi:hypothetical protein